MPQSFCVSFSNNSMPYSGCSVLHGVKPQLKKKVCILLTKFYWHWLKVNGNLPTVNSKHFLVLLHHKNTQSWKYKNASSSSFYLTNFLFLSFSPHVWFISSYAKGVQISCHYLIVLHLSRFFNTLFLLWLICNGLTLCNLLKIMEIAFVFFYII